VWLRGAVVMTASDSGRSSAHTPQSYHRQHITIIITIIIIIIIMQVVEVLAVDQQVQHVVPVPRHLVTASDAHGLSAHVP
jgi:hypothetical protein